MKRCYEKENYARITGREDSINHCGGSILVEGKYYCTRDGKIPGYAITCGDIKRLDDGEQISLLETVLHSFL